MRREVPTWVAVVVVLIVIVIVAFAYLRLSRPKQAPYIDPRQAVHQAPQMPPGVLGPGTHAGKGPVAPPGMHGGGMHGGYGVHGAPPATRR